MKSVKIAFRTVPKPFRDGSTRRARSVAAFTLLEITLALGIASSGIVMLLGLLAPGLNMFRETVDVNVSAQIAQRLVQEAVQTDYGTLTDGATTADPINKGWRYFDNEGGELPASESPSAIYHVLTRIIPASTVPRSPGLTTSHSLATVTVQVAVNPANKLLKVRANSANDPLSSTLDPDSGIRFKSFTGHIAKIK